MNIFIDRIFVYIGDIDMCLYDIGVYVFCIIYVIGNVIIKFVESLK